MLVDIFMNFYWSMCECAKTKMLLFVEQNELFWASLGENIHWFICSMMNIKTTLSHWFWGKMGNVHQHKFDLENKTKWGYLFRYSNVCHVKYIHLHIQNCFGSCKKIVQSLHTIAQKAEMLTKYSRCLKSERSFWKLNKI